MQKITLLSILSYILITNTYSQVGINNPSPNASSMLDITSTSKGLLIPRIALSGATDIITISSPVNSLLIFNTATAGVSPNAVIPGYYYWDGAISMWINLASYTLLQNINTNGKFISGDGTSTGISLSDNGTLVSKGTYGTGTALAEAGAGTKLIWYPKKAAFRAGNVDAAQWDDANIGLYSTATGFDTKASGYYSVALGIGNQATGNFTTGLGRDNVASADYATVIGSTSVASGQYSTSIGTSTTASGSFSTAMGRNVTASSSGAFIIGDGFAAPTVFNNITGNKMMMRFDNGYALYTSSTDATMGVQLGHNSNAWFTICDKRRKENFEPLNGEEILQKLSTISFTSWNYKKQDPKEYRHYGIMAQDFNHAFGHDRYGTIGNDTTVNPIDMIGIDMAAIQALEKRTSALKIENEQLQKEEATLNKKLSDITALKNENEELKQSVAQLQLSFNKQQKQIEQGLKQIEMLSIKQAAKETAGNK